MESVPFDSDLTKLEPWASDTMSRTDLPRLRAGQVFVRLLSMIINDMILATNDTNNHCLTIAISYWLLE